MGRNIFLKEHSIFWHRRFRKVLCIHEKIIHAYVRKCPVKRQMHENWNGPSEKSPTNCFKVWELRSFHGNGLFSRAESAAYANFKVPIVEEPLKQKKKVQHHT